MLPVETIFSASSIYCLTSAIQNRFNETHALDPVIDVGEIPTGAVSPAQLSPYRLEELLIEIGESDNESVGVTAGESGGRLCVFM